MTKRALDVRELPFPNPQLPSKRQTTNPPNPVGSKQWGFLKTVKVTHTKKIQEGPRKNQEGHSREEGAQEDKEMQCMFLFSSE